MSSMTDPSPDHPYRLPLEVTARIQAAARPSPGRRRPAVPATCIFGIGALLGDDGTAPDGDRPAS
jgi:hypothetical protein